VPVQLVQEGQQANAVGDFVDVWQITYIVPGNDAPLTVSVPKTADALAAALAEIESLTTFVDTLKQQP
jgi:hypothetical protein